MIFLDSNFIIALFLKKHSNHVIATKIWEDIKNKDKIIAKLIIAEVSNVLNVRLKENIELTNKVYKFMLDKLVVVEDHTYYNRALKYMNLYYPERIPFFDCVYMVLMEELGIKKIVSFDEHFDNKENFKRIY